jgi:hypothetical protein
MALLSASVCSFRKNRSSELQSRETWKELLGYKVYHSMEPSMGLRRMDMCVELSTGLKRGNMSRIHACAMICSWK